MFTSGWSTAVLAQNQPGLRTFTIEKPVEPAPLVDPHVAAALRPRPPISTDSLKTTLGVGYVQGADWGMTFQSLGSAAGVQVQLDALVTKGIHGALFDHGSLSVSDPDHGWHAEAGDLFSNLNGASRGARLSWPSFGGRHPSLAFYTPLPGVSKRPNVVAYHDQLVVKSQTVFDAEFASDKSHALRTHLGLGPVSVDTSYRRLFLPQPVRDRGAQFSVLASRHVAVTGSFVEIDQDGQRTRWWTAGIRVPITRYFDISFERTGSVTPITRTTSSAVMGNVSQGNLHFFHRYQHGETAFEEGNAAGVIAREQLQSMASYGTGQRLMFTLQLATDWSPSGHAQQWEELQTTFRLTRSTTLQSVTAIPDVLDTRRLRVQLVQQLPGHYALQAEYGRLSAFQDVPFELEHPRFRLMLNKQVSIATPARGGTVRGRVMDESGRPVGGARVVLGPYSADSDTNGVYVFKYVPRGDYELMLDSTALPADYAWDGRRRHVAITPASRETIDLMVAPLNAIHGRVYCDKNGNGRFDDGEGVQGAVVRFEDRVTATDRNGAYSFYNVWPGAYDIRLDGEHLPAAFAAPTSDVLRVVLRDDGPVTGVDFLVAEKTKPIIWREKIK